MLIVPLCLLSIFTRTFFFRACWNILESVLQTYSIMTAHFGTSFKKNLTVIQTITWRQTIYISFWMYKFLPKCICRWNLICDQVYYLCKRVGLRGTYVFSFLSANTMWVYLQKIKKKKKPPITLNMPQQSNTVSGSIKPKTVS
jgi:hypothetical protein